MKRILLLIALFLIIVGCEEKTKVVMVDEKGNVIRSNKTEWKIIGDFVLVNEKGEDHSTGDVMMDLNTGCKYVAYGHSNLSPLYDSKGEVEGCKDIKDKGEKDVK